MSKTFKDISDKLIPMLRKRSFEVHCCQTAAEAMDIAYSLIDKNGSVAWGGSKTINEIGLLNKLRKDGFKLIDRDTATTPEERQEMMRQGLLADTFLMSSNAITEDGILVNIDGMGNRVAAMCFGPQNVIVVIGKNKICSDVIDAEHRVRNVAAVKNAERFGFTKTGCSYGKCVDCLSEECMCSYIVKTRQSKIKDRIKLILVDEDLGF